ncbi:MAG: hypothetical protein ACTHZ1_07230 [Sphingobacterium sp.]
MFRNQGEVQLEAHGNPQGNMRGNAGLAITDQARQLDFNKVFLQANFSSTRSNKLMVLRKQRTLNHGTAIRVSRIKMNRFEVNEMAGQQLEENAYIEPVFFTRLALNNGFQLQYTNGWNFGLMDNQYLKGGNTVFTWGLVYNFGQK